MLLFLGELFHAKLKGMYPTRQKRLCDNLKKMAQKFVTQKFINVTEATQKSTTL